MAFSSKELSLFRLKVGVQRSMHKGKLLLHRSRYLFFYMER